MIRLIKMLLIVGSFWFGLMGFLVFVMEKSAFHEIVSVLAVGFCGLFIGQLGQIIAIQGGQREIKAYKPENKNTKSTERVDPKF